MVNKPHKSFYAELQINDDDDDEEDEAQRKSWRMKGGLCDAAVKECYSSELLTDAHC